MFGNAIGTLMSRIDAAAARTGARSSRGAVGV
jgi:hypothetical protein